MAELVREMVVDASPATIFEFLTVPEKHVEWMGSTSGARPAAGRRLPGEGR